MLKGEVDQRYSYTRRLVRWAVCLVCVVGYGLQPLTSAANPVSDPVSYPVSDSVGNNPVTGSVSRPVGTSVGTSASNPVNDLVNQVGPNAIEQENHAEILQHLTQADIVYLGEQHDSAADHAAQLEIIQALYRSRGELTIVLEMIQRPFQAALDAYIAGEIDEATLLDRTEYQTRWGFDWELYAPIFRYARAHQIRLIAANTPQEITRKVAAQGLDSLSGEDWTHIPPRHEIRTERQTETCPGFTALDLSPSLATPDMAGIDAPNLTAPSIDGDVHAGLATTKNSAARVDRRSCQDNRDYRAALQAFYDHHLRHDLGTVAASSSPESPESTDSATSQAQTPQATPQGEDSQNPQNDGFERFFAAQVLWDETIAETIAQTYQQQPDRPIVVLAGQMHIIYDWGVPSRVQRRLGDQVAQTSVLFGVDPSEFERQPDPKTTGAPSPSQSPNPQNQPRSAADFFWSF